MDTIQPAAPPGDRTRPTGRLGREAVRCRWRPMIEIAAGAATALLKAFARRGRSVGEERPLHGFPQPIGREWLGQEVEVFERGPGREDSPVSTGANRPRLAP